MDSEKTIAILSATILAGVLLYILYKKIISDIENRSKLIQRQKRKREKRYLPVEFKRKYWIGGGPTQIGIGIGLCVFSFAKKGWHCIFSSWYFVGNIRYFSYN